MSGTINHSAPNYVIACVDFRFQNEFLQTCDQKLGKKTYDYQTFPGASKALIDKNSRQIIIDCIKTIQAIHQTKTVVVIDHKDCGAYGGSQRFNDTGKEQKFHFEQLAKAGEILQKACPGLKIKLWYWTPEGTIEVIGS